MKKEVIDWQFNAEYYKNILVPQINRINSMMAYTREYGMVMRELRQMFVPLAGPISRYSPETYDRIQEMLNEATNLQKDHGLMEQDQRRPSRIRLRKLNNIEFKLAKLLADIQILIYGTIDEMNMFFKRKQTHDGKPIYEQ